ncbi:restriction endonuclease subunit S [Bradyrhizobium sp. LA7.1]|uniref:restriction endonuclease subunit S n=1 Tax=Bradyrhizobium sp. LA7.1 TaxID=3156324 RepID=UPI0033934E0D
MSAWPIVRLSDVTTLSSGGTPSKANAAFWAGDIPWVSPKDMKTACVVDAEDKITRAAVDESAARVVGTSSVLAVVRSGILAHTFPVATIAREVAFNQDIKAITPKNGSLLPAYLYWMLKGQEARILSIGVKKGATVHSLSNGFLEALAFPLPPLEEQRRIVGLLDRAAEVRRRADAARAKARTIIPALFLEMFGDPATNPKGWSRQRLGEVIDGIVGGKNIEAGKGSSPYRILKVSAVTSGYFRPDEAKPAPDQYQPMPEHHIRAGDFLFSRANTSALVGAVAIVEGDASSLLLPDKIWRIEWRREVVEPRFMYSTLRSSEVRRVFAQVASGTSDSMKNISQGKLRSIEVPIPPLSLQIDFAQQAECIEATARALNAAVTKADAMAAALSAEVFG